MSGFHVEGPQTTASEGLAQGPYTWQLELDSTSYKATNVPPLPYISIMYLFRGRVEPVKPSNYTENGALTCMSVYELKFPAMGQLMRQRPRLQTHLVTRLYYSDTTAECRRIYSPAFITQI